MVIVTTNCNRRTSCSHAGERLEKKRDFVSSACYHLLRMNFDQYIDLNDADGPKLVGHRIWLNQILFEVVHNWRNADQLIERFPTLDRETVYACLLYFEQNRSECLTRLYADIDRKQNSFVEALEIESTKSNA